MRVSKFGNEKSLERLLSVYKIFHLFSREVFPLLCIIVKVKYLEKVATTTFFVFIESKFFFFCEKK